jgi:hypothetical protein
MPSRCRGIKLFCCVCMDLVHGIMHGILCSEVHAGAKFILHHPQIRSEQRGGGDELEVSEYCTYRSVGRPVDA